MTITYSAIILAYNEEVWLAKSLPTLQTAMAKVPAAGCFVYCLREGYEAAGGFSEKVFASEEIWFSRRLRRWGKPKGLEFRVILDPPIVSSARKLQDRPVKNFLGFCFMLVFPWAIYSRRLSFFWYRRRS